MPFFFEHDKVFIWILGGIFVYKQFQNSRHCKSYRIPFGTLHYDTCKNKGDFKDAYFVEMPRMYTGLKLDVDLVAKSFFTSRVFTYGERFLLKYVGLYPEPEFPLVKRFEVGETVYCWKVVDRTEDEILFQWKAAGFRGYTWFHRPPGTLQLVFGNSIPSPQVTIDKKTNQPETNASIMLKRGTFAGVMALVGPLHTMYSRSLLISAQKVMTVLPK